MSSLTAHCVNFFYSTVLNLNTELGRLRPYYYTSVWRAVDRCLANWSHINYKSMKNFL